MEHTESASTSPIPLQTEIAPATNSLESNDATNLSSSTSSSSNQVESNANTLTEALSKLSNHLPLNGPSDTLDLPLPNSTETEPNSQENGMDEKGNEGQVNATLIEPTLDNIEHSEVEEPKPQVDSTSSIMDPLVTTTTTTTTTTSTSSTLPIISFTSETGAPSSSVELSPIFDAMQSVTEPTTTSPMDSISISNTTPPSTSDVSLSPVPSSTSSAATAPTSSTLPTTMEPAPSLTSSNTLPIIDRKDHIKKIKAAYMVREDLRSMNLQLQSKISEIFRKRRTEDKNIETDKSVGDQEKRYLSIMLQYKDLVDAYEVLKSNNNAHKGELKAKLEEKRVEVASKADELRKYRRQIALTSEYSRTGEAIPLKIMEQLESLDEKKESQVSIVRLENIKLRNKLKRHEQVLHQKEELAEGLHLIDFEQLKIENQTYNEKIEERNEEIMKLRKKITNVVQVLAHIKEKLEFVQSENKELNHTLQELEGLVSKERDLLPQAKQKRDALRKSNIYLKQKHGLLGNFPLLKDFEIRVDDCDALEKEIQKLEKAYEKITMHAQLLALEKRNKQRLPRLLALS